MQTYKNRDVRPLRSEGATACSSIIHDLVSRAYTRVCNLKDTIKIQPRDFGIDRAQAIEDEINRRYSNKVNSICSAQPSVKCATDLKFASPLPSRTSTAKVVPGLGLCICCRDILQAGEGIVLYGDGNLYHKGTKREPALQDSCRPILTSLTLPSGILVSHVSTYDRRGHHRKSCIFFT